MSHFGRVRGGHGRIDFDGLAKLFHRWPNTKEYHISECGTVRVYYFGHDSSSFCIEVIDLVFIKKSSQIYLPYDILGIFILFVLDPNKKNIYILDPLPRPTWGVHILKNMDICNKLNLAIRLANPEWTRYPNGDVKSLLFRQTRTCMKIYT